MVLVSKLARVLDAKAYTVLPGKNTVSEEEMALLKDEPMVKRFLKEGSLSFVKEGTRIPKELNVDLKAKLAESGARKGLDPAAVETEEA